MKKLVYPLVFLLATIILTLPTMIRLANNKPFMSGEEPYYNARLASYIVQHGLPAKDHFAFEGRGYRINPYQIPLAVLSYFLGIETASFILPLFFGLASLFLFYRILKKLNAENLRVFSPCLIFLLSPVTVAIFSSSYSNSMIAFLFLLCFWLYSRKDKASFLLSMLLFIVLSFFGLTHAFVAILLAFIYSRITKSGLKKFYAVLIPILILIVIYLFPFYLSSEKIDFGREKLISEFVSDFGGSAGFSVFMLVLTPAGLFVLWNQNKKLRVLLLFTAFAVVYSIFNRDMIVYSNFIISFFSGVALSSLTAMQWKLPKVRAFTLIILWCGLAVSLFSHIFLLSALGPNSELADGLRWLKENSSSNDKVFSHYSNGFWIQYFAERPVLMDSLFQNVPNAKIFYQDSDSIFRSNNLKITRGLLSKHKIDYIVLTKNMYQGVFWDDTNLPLGGELVGLKSGGLKSAVLNPPLFNKEEKGLGFLLRNNETFKNRYNNSFVSIFEYIYQDEK